MSFLARLASDLIPAEAGATTPTTVEIINRGDASDQFELVLEGLDPEWTAIPVPVVTVEAHETQQEKVFFKPPRVSESSAGNYPFVLKVRSLTTGESRSVQGVLALKPFHHISLELNPKKGFISPIRKQNTFEATLINLGNVEHTLQLSGNDPEERCVFSLDQEQVVLGAGQQKAVLVTVSPSGQNFFSGSRLFGFTLTARSIEQPSVVAVAQAQLEQRPLLSLGSLVAMALVIFVVGLWIYLIPKPPTFEVSVDKTEILKGDSVNLTWHTTGDPASVHILAQNHPIYDGAQPNGSQAYTPVFAPDEPSQNFEVSGYVEKDGKRYPLKQTILIAVKDPPKIDAPRIDAFKFDHTNLILGQPVTIHYKVSNAVKLVLLPQDKELDPNLDQVQITPDNVSTTEFKLVATNSAGVLAQKSVRVTVTQASRAKIIAFSASPMKVEGTLGEVTLNWQVTNSVRVELKFGDQDRQLDAAGSTTITLDKTTTLILTAYDDAGIIDRRVVKIEVVAPPVPPVQPDSTTGTPSTTGSPTTTTGSTTGGLTTGTGGTTDGGGPSNR